MEQQEPIFEQYLNDGQAYMLMMMPRDLVAECGRGFGKGLVLQLLEVEKLSFVQDNVVERQRVAGTASILADQVDDGAIVERNGILPVGRLEDRFLPAEGLPWLFSYGIMAVTPQTPVLPVDHP